MLADRATARYSQGKLIKRDGEVRSGHNKNLREPPLLTTLYQRVNSGQSILLSQVAWWQLLMHFRVCTTYLAFDMTAELESDMTSVAEGKDTRDGVVTHSRALALRLIRLIDRKGKTCPRPLPTQLLLMQRWELRPMRQRLLKSSLKTRGSF